MLSKNHSQNGSFQKIWSVVSEIIVYQTNVVAYGNIFNKIIELVELGCDLKTKLSTWPTLEHI